jgi:hypothetical protein
VERRARGAMASVGVQAVFAATAQPRGLSQVGPGAVRPQQVAIAGAGRAQGGKRPRRPPRKFEAQRHRKESKSFRRHPTRH